MKRRFRFEILYTRLVSEDTLGIAIAFDDYLRGSAQ